MNFIELSRVKVCSMLVDGERWKVKSSNNCNNGYIFFQNNIPVNIQQICQCLLFHQAECEVLGYMYRPSPRGQSGAWVGGPDRA